MRNLILIVLATVFISACSSGPNKVIYMVRHAEKDVVPKNNPGLTTEGVMRSVDLQRWFKDITIDTIYSTNFTRTIETVKPLAEARGIEIGIYNAKKFEEFAIELESLEADTILICGHSNTILEQIEAFGIERPQPEIQETENDKIFEIQLGNKTVISHSYGKAYE